MRFDFVDLRLLVHVAEAGNLTAGAARLPIALSAASQRIRKLETLFGVSLFERERDGVRLTADGERCVEHARLLLRGADRMQRELTHPAQQGRHVLRLAATTVTTAEFLPDVLGRFLALHPQVDVEIDERQSAAAIQAIRDGEHDLGIIDGNTGAERLALLPFSRDKLVLVAHAGHPLAARQQVSFAEALDHPFVALRPDSGMQQFIERAALLHGGKLQVRLRFNPIANGGLRQVALTGGLTLRPRQGGESLPQNGVNKTLKNLLQEAGMPPYRRERLPLIYQNDTLLAAPGAGINTELLAAEPDVGYVPVWLPYDGY